MTISYFDELGLDYALTKPNERTKSPDLEIEDESISGIKLMKKSVSLDRLYGQNLEIGGSSNISGILKIFDDDNTQRITIDASTGINVQDDDGSTVFSTTISGDDVGDVSLGDYSGGSGLFYDKSGSSLYFKGNLMATSISGGTINGTVITGGSININNLFKVNSSGALTATSGTIGGWTIGATTLTGGAVTLNSTGTISGGSITGTAISGSTIMINHQPGGGDPGNNAYLRWSLNSRMWEDSSGNLGINSINGTGGNAGFYIYTNNQEKAFFGVTNINFKQKLYVPQVDLHVEGVQTEGDIYNINVLRGYNDLGFDAPTEDFKFTSGGHEYARIVHNSGKFVSESSYIKLGNYTLRLKGTVDNAYMQITSP
jgi:hypothetical protein